MKFNLKNFPEALSIEFGKMVQDLGSEEALRRQVQKMEKWKEGFEKDLRKLMEQSAWTTTMVRNIGVGHKKTLWLEMCYVKELLGEDKHDC